MPKNEPITPDIWVSPVIDHVLFSLSLVLLLLHRPPSLRFHLCFFILTLFKERIPSVCLLFNRKNSDRLQIFVDLPSLETVTGKALNSFRF